MSGYRCKIYAYITCIIFIISLLFTGCSLISDQNTTKSTEIRPIVATNNNWASLAKGLVGDKVEVDSIITSDVKDPLNYKPTQKDISLLKRSGLIIQNGIGYDDWVPEDIKDIPVLNIGNNFSLRKGNNPYIWMSLYYTHIALTEIKNKIIEVYPDLADYVQINFVKLNQKVLDLQNYIDRVRMLANGENYFTTDVLVNLFASFTIGLNNSVSFDYKKFTNHFQKADQKGVDSLYKQIESVKMQKNGHKTIMFHNLQNPFPQTFTLTNEAKKLQTNSFQVIEIYETVPDNYIDIIDYLRSITDAVYKICLMK